MLADADSVRLVFQKLISWLRDADGPHRDDLTYMRWEYDALRGRLPDEILEAE